MQGPLPESSSVGSGGSLPHVAEVPSPRLMRMSSTSTAADTDHGVNHAELQAHLQKFQSFMQSWVALQRDLLGCGDNAIAATLPSSQRMDERSLNTSRVDIDVASTDAIWNNKQLSPISAPIESPEEIPGNLATVVTNSIENRSLSKDTLQSLESPRWGSTPSRKSDHFAHRISEEYLSDGEHYSDLHVFIASVSKKGFEVACVMVILANSIVIGMAADYSMGHTLDETSTTLDSSETAFIVFYTVEVLLRVCAKGRLFCTEPVERNWNLFDSVLVVHGIWEQAVILGIWGDMSGDSDSTEKLTNLRLFRLMKLVRLLRMVRVLRMFKELRLILSSMAGCLHAMFWAGVVLLAITYIFGVAILSGCAIYTQTHSNIDAMTRESIDQFWGSVGLSVLSLFMACTGGDDWINIARPLKQVGGFFYALFLLYIAIFVFVVVNVINSIFLESILSHAERDHQLIIETQMEKKSDYIASLTKIFEDMDIDGDGEVSYSEFCAKLYCPRMQAFAASLDIEITDAKKFFEVLSDRGKRSVDISTFVVGCIRFRGPAKSIDLADLANHQSIAFLEQRKAFQQIDQLHNICKLQDQRIVTNFDKLCQHVQQLLAEQRKTAMSLQGFQPASDVDPVMTSGSILFSESPSSFAL